MARRYKIIRLCNLSPLHIGTGRDDCSTSSSELPSDTISAALVAMKAQLADSIDAQAFMESFAISSAFPFICKKLFFPKPMGRLLVQGCNEELIRKKLKKVKYIEFSQWKEMIMGNALDIEEKQLSGEFLLDKDGNHKKPYIYQVNERVAVSRDGGDATPFYFKWQYHSPDAGLFCLIDCSEDTFAEIKKLFELLGETGIGSDKSVGGGKFEIAADEIELPEVQDADSTLLLSHYIPTREEIEQIDLEASQYEITQRGGDMAGSSVQAFQHLLKKSVYMIKTGSLISGVHKIKGKIADVTPNWNDQRIHPTLRCGCPIVLPIKKQKL